MQALTKLVASTLQPIDQIEFSQSSHGRCSVYVIDEFDCADSCRDTMQNVAIFELLWTNFRLTSIRIGAVEG